MAQEWIDPALWRCGVDELLIRARHELVIDEWDVRITATNFPGHMTRTELGVVVCDRHSSHSTFHVTHWLPEQRGEAAGLLDLVQYAFLGVFGGKPGAWNGSSTVVATGQLFAAGIGSELAPVLQQLRTRQRIIRRLSLREFRVGGPRWDAGTEFLRRQ